MTRRVVPAMLIALVALVALAGPAGAQTTTYTSTETIPVPPASNFAAPGGGDGWDVSMSPTEVFNVFHHQGSLNVACHKQSDGSECYPVRNVNDGGQNFTTSDHSGTYLDQGTGRLYVYATRQDATAGVVCVDTTVAATNANPFCGFTALTPATEGGETSLPMKVGNRLYAFNYGGGAGSANKLLCLDLSSIAACAGQPYGLDFGGTPTFTNDATAAIGDQVLIPMSTTDGPRIGCFDDSLQAECAGTWPVDPGPGYVNSDNGSPYPHLDASGAITGFCLPNSTAPCFGLDGSGKATPPNLAAAIGSDSTRYNGQAVTIGARVYVAHGDDDTIRCFNFATGAGCENFPHPTTDAGYIYTVNRDPQRPTCLWVNADFGSKQIQTFDAFTGGACGQGATRVLSEQLVASDKDCEPATYRRFEVLKPERSGYTDGVIAFADNNGGSAGIADKPLDANGGVDLTGIGLEAVDRPQFLVTLNGTPQDPSEVVVRLTWEGTFDQKCVGQGVEAEAPPSPTPTPTPTSSPTPEPTVDVVDDADRSCRGKRRFRIVLRNQSRIRYRSASFTLGGKKIKSRRFGRKIGAIIDLRRMGKRTITLRIRAVTSKGDVLKGKRVYHPCTKKIKKKKPPKL